MIPNYNRVSWFYDALARLIFGSKLEYAKMAQLNQIKTSDKVLIVGGGSGSILKYLDEKTAPRQVDFVEYASTMLRKAQQVELKHLKVNFKPGDILLHEQGNYDVIITNFFFDQYGYAECENYILHLKGLARPGASLLYADFILSSRWRDRVIRKAMYLFFRLTLNLGKVQLLNHKTIFLKHGIECQRTIPISSFIVSEMYKIS